MDTTETLTEVFTEATTAVAEYVHQIANDVHVIAVSVSAVDTILRWIVVGIVAIALYKLLRIFF